MLVVGAQGADKQAPAMLAKGARTRALAPLARLVRPRPPSWIYIWGSELKGLGLGSGLGLELRVDDSYLGFRFNGLGFRV
jgi:hypothetical protein